MIKMVAGRPVRSIAVVLALTGVFVAGVRPASVAAYGSQHVYEITLSLNCVNVIYCGGSTDGVPNNAFGIAGLWGWYELDGGPTSGPADGEVDAEGHLNSVAELNGTVRSTGVGPWFEISCASPSPSPYCIFVAIDQTPADPNGNYFVIPTDFVFTSGAYSGQTFPFLDPLLILVPATPGKYSYTKMPGVRSEVTVTQVP